MLKAFIVRQSLDYSLRVMAETPEEACKIAQKKPLDDWGYDKSDMDAEEEE